MNVKGMLFNTDEVRAILDGRKTVTRRVVNYKHLRGLENLTAEKIQRACVAPCQIGDILYVRETWRLVDFTYIDTDWSASVQYKADMAEGERWHDLSPDECIGWRPSIHMPRKAARIWLRVTDVRVERLQDMSDKDAIVEGVRIGMGGEPYFSCLDAFKALWDSTIKPADRERYGWAVNPWVWVIAFERCEKPEE